MDNYVRTGVISNMIINIKKTLCIILLGSTIWLLSGCEKSDTVVVAANNAEELYYDSLGISNLIRIQDGLYYDGATRIVYMWNGWKDGKRYTPPSPYYAPNGNPYRYNPDKNMFEVIE